MARSLRFELYEFHTMGKSKAVGYVGFTLGDGQQKPPQSDLIWRKANIDDDFKAILDACANDGGDRLIMKLTVKAM